MSTLNNALLEKHAPGGKIGLDSDMEKMLYEALIRGTKASNSFPGENDDLGYFENIPEFQDRVVQFRDRIVKLILQMAANVDSSDELFNLSYLKNADPTDVESFEPISNVIELLMENVDSCLDEAKSAQPTVPSYAKAAAGLSSGGDASNRQVVVSKSELVRDVRAGLHGVITHANIDRPQLRFKTPIDNSRSPFRPKISEKTYNCLVPLPTGGLRLMDPDSSVSGSQPRFPNPYEPEIRAALQKLPQWLFESSVEVAPKPLDQVPCTWVETEEQLMQLCGELRGHMAIAIDLENHSYRSFQGFACLMQISTPVADYLVDTLALRDSMYVLNEFFTNPNIIKVLHGADYDVHWLQRDFGLYLVGLFDTGRAARALNYSSAGLAHALNRHCNIRVNKAFQLADWRIRPLTEDMFKYAREDTHYLLYIFNQMRNELLQQGGQDGVYAVLRRSAEIALTTYEKDVFTDHSYLKLIQTKGLKLSEAQTQIFSEVYGWRDAIARREDESAQYVLPDRMLIRIIQEMPGTAAELERCCNPLPPIVQTRVTELLALVRSTRNTKRGNRKTTLTAKATPSAIRSPPADGPSGGFQMGLNSSKSTFVPINMNDTTPKKAHAVTFAEAAKGGLNAGRRGSLMRDEANARATPSPVLTTEQLYDTAGWQDVADPNWKAAVVAKTNSRAAQAQTRSPNKTANLQQGKNDSYRVAAETRARIGEEQRGEHFGSLVHKTPFAAMASAMSKNSPLSMDDNVESADSGTNTPAPARVATLPAKTSVAEDAVIDIDTPADADALESEDIARSMAEIYRISNRNRKRNKDMKKFKEDEPTGKKTTEKSEERDEEGDRKRHKEEDENNDYNGGGGDDAIDFMRDIGWVEGATKPVATLLVQGAPDGPSHLAGAGAIVENSGGGSKSGTGGKSGGSKGRGGRKNIPSSPRRRPQQSGSGNAQNRPQQKGQQQSRPYGYAQAASGAGAYSPPQKPVSGGFSYSQAAASSAGVRYNASSQGGSGRNTRGGDNANGNHRQQQQVYRGKSGGYSKSMSYK
mmetsp:Transcript_10413/g.16981  ORF Transcript_10413/g.16981 Transcript_10413/m.16981 type:complete len:1036 (-) Transcript_10413:1283-4390(-)|eukprot:CAMPEP_0203757742 /NCGR_PEP_ID=MMETSP0098-20131031/10663_1 /ASSEMBLY_ACC=CAM_ASM_000208 /TAXON_ID=96639 /ORGANISM=" , Strain NY0313808BC1" /LENGTH=1035 /DNA_ID=CAMNT_0050649973 /DNA_START=313 /DNA_END=3420 /DNA_ORIENTATION=+